VTSEIDFTLKTLRGIIPMMKNICLIVLLLSFLFFISLSTSNGFNVDASDESQNQQQDRDKSERWVTDPSLEFCWVELC
jgi:hypothetical protein